MIGACVAGPMPVHRRALVLTAWIAVEGFKRERQRPQTACQCRAGGLFPVALSAKSGARCLLESLSGLRTRLDRRILRAWRRDERCWKLAGHYAANAAHAERRSYTYSRSNSCSYQCLQYLGALPRTLEQYARALPRGQSSSSSGHHGSRADALRAAGSLATASSCRTSGGTQLDRRPASLDCCRPISASTRRKTACVMPKPRGVRRRAEHFYRPS